MTVNFDYTPEEVRLFNEITDRAFGDIKLEMTVTATFMVVGMLSGNGTGLAEKRYTKLLERWANSAVELHTTICEYAETSEKIIAFLCGNKTDFDFPGGYDYEVSEPFGQWFGDHLLNHEAAPQTEVANKKLSELASDFFMLDEFDRQMLNVFIEGLGGPTEDYEVDLICVPNFFARKP